MSECRKKLNRLDEEINEVFNSLVNNQEYNFIVYNNANIDSDMLAGLPTTDIRDEIFGEIFSKYILKVNKTGITCVDFGNIYNPEVIQFTQLSSVVDKVILIEDMHKYLLEHHIPIPEVSTENDW